MQNFSTKNSSLQKILQKKQSMSFYFQNLLAPNYKVDERKRNSVFYKHIAPVAETEIVNLQIYYRTRRLGNLIIKNKLWKNPDKVTRKYVVYH